ncbi:elongation factor P [Vicingaceae bacterium]|nr:elongation factor P [Vicingaceae bacterium]MDB4082671.1 elongation factor P [Vicingaceae bacterium]MDC1452324.1 elongation factor P [Vicingaceae bacterium]
MANTSDFKNGLCMNWNSDLYKILEFQHVKPGKGPAFVRTKMQSLTSGKIIDNTFNAGVKIDPVRIETRQYQFLFNDEQGFHFMNTDDYEQTFLQKEMINAPQFLKEGDMVDIMYHAEEEKPLSCDLPAFVNLEITFTEPGIKGDTATNATKPATVETGAEVRVPLFINEGDRIRIDTRDGSYCERLKS